MNTLRIITLLSLIVPSFSCGSSSQPKLSSAKAKIPMSSSSTSTSSSSSSSSSALNIESFDRMKNELAKFYSRESPIPETLINTVFAITKHCLNSPDFVPAQISHYPYAQHSCSAIESINASMNDRCNTLVADATARVKSLYETEKTNTTDKCFCGQYHHVRCDSCDRTQYVTYPDCKDTLTCISLLRAKTAFSTHDLSTICLVSHAVDRIISKHINNMITEPLPYSIPSLPEGNPAHQSSSSTTTSTMPYSSSTSRAPRSTALSTSANSSFKSLSTKLTSSSTSTSSSSSSSTPDRKPFDQMQDELTKFYRPGSPIPETLTNTVFEVVKYCLKLPGFATNFHNHYLPECPAIENITISPDTSEACNLIIADGYARVQSLYETDPNTTNKCFCGQYHHVCCDNCDNRKYVVHPACREILKCIALLRANMAFSTQDEPTACITSFTVGKIIIRQLTNMTHLDTLRYPLALPNYPKRETRKRARSDNATSSSTITTTTPSLSSTPTARTSDKKTTKTTS